MARRLINEFSLTINRFEDAIANIIYRHIQKDLCIADCNILNKPQSNFSLRDFLNDAYLWAVPKHRRPIERRWSRRFGFKDFGFWKPLVPKTNLITCRTCGHFHESHTVCNYCWEQIKKESEEIQEQLVKKYKLDPVKEDLVVFYEGEKEVTASEYWKGKRIVELPKKRPHFFQHNLLEPTTQPLSDSKEIAKPEDLA